MSTEQLQNRMNELKKKTKELQKLLDKAMAEAKKEKDKVSSESIVDILGLAIATESHKDWSVSQESNKELTPYGKYSVETPDGGEKLINIYLVDSNEKAPSPNQKKSLDRIANDFNTIASKGLNSLQAIIAMTQNISLSFTEILRKHPPKAIVIQKNGNTTFYLDNKQSKDKDYGIIFTVNSKGAGGQVADKLETQYNIKL